ncbi:hypothetical protein O3P69_020386 [Scylla paramamosain]|uniref:Uncharacterized protein n=1 Tax=Scylla paramamosain TaxID=85552 RepID=A0AAW0TNX0_SCYPA
MRRDGALRRHHPDAGDCKLLMVSGSPLCSLLRVPRGGLGSCVGCGRGPPSQGALISLERLIDMVSNDWWRRALLRQPAGHRLGGWRTARQHLPSAGGGLLCMTRHTMSLARRVLRQGPWPPSRPPRAAWLEDDTDVDIEWHSMVSDRQSRQPGSLGASTPVGGRLTACWTLGRAGCCGPVGAGRRLAASLAQSYRVKHLLFRSAAIDILIVASLSIQFGLFLQHPAHYTFPLRRY